MALRRTPDEVFRLKIDGADVKPSAVSLRQLSRILEATARLIEQVGAEADLPVPAFYLRNVLTGSAVPIVRSSDPAAAKPVLKELAKVIRTRAKESGPGVFRALEELIEATGGPGRAKFIGPGFRSVTILPPAPPKMAIDVADELHVHVTGLVVARRATEVYLKPVDGGPAEAFLADREVAANALRLFDKTAVASVVYRKIKGRLRPSWLEKIVAWNERSLIEIVDELHARMAQDGVDFEATKWVSEIDS